MYFHSECRYDIFSSIWLYKIYILYLECLILLWNLSSLLEVWLEGFSSRSTSLDRQLSGQGFGSGPFWTSTSPRTFQVHFSAATVSIFSSPLFFSSWNEDLRMCRSYCLQRFLSLTMYSPVPHYVFPETWSWKQFIEMLNPWSDTISWTIAC